MTDLRQNRKVHYWQIQREYCVLCGSPIYCGDARVLGGDSSCDYLYFCSNGVCQNHINGESLGDMEKNQIGFHFVLSPLQHIKKLSETCSNDASFGQHVRSLLKYIEDSQEERMCK